MIKLRLRAVLCSIHKGGSDYFCPVRLLFPFYGAIPLKLFIVSPTTPTTLPSLTKRPVAIFNQQATTVSTRTCVTFQPGICVSRSRDTRRIPTLPAPTPSTGTHIDRHLVVSLTNRPYAVSGVVTRIPIECLQSWMPRSIRFPTMTRSWRFQASDVLANTQNSSLAILTSTQVGLACRPQRPGPAGSSKRDEKDAKVATGR